MNDQPHSTFSSTPLPEQGGLRGMAQSNKEDIKSQLEQAISESTASDYDKGNILYLAEKLADTAQYDEARDILQAMEDNNDPWRGLRDIVRDRLRQLEDTHGTK